MASSLNEIKSRDKEFKGTVYGICKVLFYAFLIFAICMQWEVVRGGMIVSMAISLYLAGIMISSIVNACVQYMYINKQQ